MAKGVEYFFANVGTHKRAVIAYKMDFQRSHIFYGACITVAKDRNILPVYKNRMINTAVGRLAKCPVELTQLTFLPRPQIRKMIVSRMHEYGVRAKNIDADIETCDYDDEHIVVRLVKKIVSWIL